MFVRKFARASMMMMMSEAAAAAKESSTAGPVAQLIKIYQLTMDDIQNIPEKEGYRKAVEATTRKRLDICLEEQDPEVIEKRIDCGKFEELVEEAKLEYRIVINLLEWNPWKLDLDQAYVSNTIYDFDQVPKAEPPGPIPDELYEGLKALAKVTCEKDERKTVVFQKTSYSEEPEEM